VKITSLIRLGLGRGMGGRETGDDGTLERHTDTQTHKRLTPKKREKMPVRGPPTPAALPTTGSSAPSSLQTSSLPSWPMACLPTPADASLSSLLRRDPDFSRFSCGLSSSGAGQRSGCALLDGRLRCRPNFLVIGVTKAGTTALYRYLRQHPRVGASAVKEPAYFGSSNATTLSLRAYLALFPACEACARGEATPSYAWRNSAPAAALAASQLLGRAVRLLMLVREPVERAASHYSYFRRRRFSAARNLSSALTAALDEFSLCAAQLGGLWDRRCTYRPGRRAAALEAAARTGTGTVVLPTLRHLARGRKEYELVQAGLYAEHLITWRRRFDAGSLLVLEASGLWSDPLASLRRVEAHLGLPAFEGYALLRAHTLPAEAREAQAAARLPRGRPAGFVPVAPGVVRRQAWVKASGSAEAEPLETLLLGRLRSFFQPHNARLAAMTGVRLVT